MSKISRNKRSILYFFSNSLILNNKVVYHYYLKSNKAQILSKKLKVAGIIIDFCGFYTTLTSQDTEKTIKVWHQIQSLMLADVSPSRKAEGALQSAWLELRVQLSFNATSWLFLHCNYIIFPFMQEWSPGTNGCMYNSLIISIQSDN